MTICGCHKREWSTVTNKIIPEFDTAIPAGAKEGLHKDPLHGLNHHKQTFSSKQQMSLYLHVRQTPWIVLQA